MRRRGDCSTRKRYGARKRERVFAVARAQRCRSLLGQSHGSAGTLLQLIEGVPEFLRKQNGGRTARRTLDHMLSVHLMTATFRVSTIMRHRMFSSSGPWSTGHLGCSRCSFHFQRIPPSRRSEPSSRPHMETRSPHERAHELSRHIRYALIRSVARVIERRITVSHAGARAHARTREQEIRMQLYAAQMTQNLTPAYRALAFQVVVRTPLLSDPNKMRQPQLEPKTP